MSIRAVLLLALSSVACVDLSRPVLFDAAGDRPVVLSSDAGDGPVLADDAPDAALSPVDESVDQSTDAAPPDAPLLGNGKTCGGGTDCDSGFCVKGLCCNNACGLTCYACDVAGMEGTCSPVTAGEDPDNVCAQDPAASCGRDGTCDGAGACRRYGAGSECAPGSCAGSTETAARTCDGNGTCLPATTRSCAPATCTANSCATNCTTGAQCQTGFFCDAGKCAVKRTVATACTDDGQCATGFCVDGICCGSRCGEFCYACNVANAVGTCTAVPAGQDPRTQCPAQPVPSCGRAGGCNGGGACLLYPASTVCGSGSCTGTIETSGPKCNGLGVCSPTMIRACDPYVCGASGTCATTCTTSATCRPGSACSTGACVPASGLLLYWRFEETTGTVAIDSSPNALNGTYIGDTGVPAPSSVVPPVAYPDTLSRLFTRANRDAITLPTMPASLRPANSLTLSAWYRATDVDLHGTDVIGSEVISGGNSYILRLRPTLIEIAKRINATDSTRCQGTAANYLNGAWHHLAAVFSPTAVTLYYDGVQSCTQATTDAIYYPASTDLFVGRHGAGETQWDFQGNIDEVRIYNRVLSPAEVAALAQGMN